MNIGAMGGMPGPGMLARVQGVRDAVGSAAEEMGLSRDALREGIANGVSVAETAEQAGVSREELVSGLTAALEDAGLGARAGMLAERLADVDQPPGSRFGGGRPFGAAGGPGPLGGTAEGPAALLQQLSTGVEPGEGSDLLSLIFPSGSLADEQA